MRPSRGNCKCQCTAQECIRYLCTAQEGVRFLCTAQECIRFLSTAQECIRLRSTGQECIKFLCTAPKCNELIGGIEKPMWPEQNQQERGCYKMIRTSGRGQRNQTGAMWATEGSLDFILYEM